MPRGLDDITLEVHDVKDRPLVARLFFPRLGDKAANVWGDRKEEYLENGPMIQLYTPLASPRATCRDVLGRPLYVCSERTLKARRLANGKLRITPGRARNGEPKRYSRTLPAEEVECLLELLVNADEHLAVAKESRRRRLLERWRARQATNVTLIVNARARPSSLAEA